MDSPASALVRRAVREHQPYEPGVTLEAARRRYGLERIIKLSSNENPLGASPRAQAALAHLSGLSVYGDNDYHELRERVAGHLGLSVEEVIVGHGSNELLALMFETFIDPGERIVMATPTFSLYRQNAQVREAEIVEVPLRDGVHDLEAMLAAVDANTKCVAICDPNNPTGTCVTPQAMARFVAGLPPNVLLVIDQAYREYMPEASVDGVALVRSRPNTLVYRTMSKCYGLASLRIGYAAGAADAIAYMQRIRLPFNVARPAVVAALAAFDDLEFVQRSVTTNAAGRTWLSAQLTRLGMSVYPSAANFLGVRVEGDARAVADELLRRGIAVRAGIGPPDLLRITVGTPEENAVLVAAFEAMRAEHPAPIHA